MNKIIPKIIKITITILILIISLILYSRYIATKGLTVREYKITNPKITDNFHGFKIVQISDIHYGNNIYLNELENIINQVNKLKPNIIVFTGDLIDQKTNLDEKTKENIINTLNKLNKTSYKIAIKGEEDFNNNYDEIIKKSGFTELNNTYKLIYNKTKEPILIAGITSNLKDPEKIDTKLESTYNYLEKNNTTYNIILLHEPDYIENINTSLFDLALAGHSHNGQIIIPKIGGLIIPKGAKKYKNKYYKIKNTDLYISGGIGTNKIPFRLFNHPSINLYRLTNH